MNKKPPIKINKTKITPKYFKYKNHIKKNNNKP
jgi:hypothetical protein